MFKAQPWGRAALTGAMVAVCAAACQNVLDIEEPKPLPNDSVAGAAGAAGNDGVSSKGGTGGDGDGNRAMAGEGGQSISAAGAGGEAGATITPECDDNAVRCGGETNKTPQICVTGQWTQNTEQAAGDCTTECDSGLCVECLGTEKRCSVCAEDDENCSQRVPQTCKDGAWTSAAQPCEHYCSAGSCVDPASCAPESAAMATDCGGESCCVSLYVPGGEFKRNYAEVEPFVFNNFPAKISPFLLDKFEVTVGRMQQFVAAFDHLDLNDGDGKAPHIVDDQGWNVKNALPMDATTLKANLASCGAGSSWIEGGGSQHKLPINCVDFNTAYAFCIWDGGRLPTDAEWNFAAAGGDEQRLYPWPPPVEGPGIDESYAVFNSADALPFRVGSKSKGNGRWGHADLAGNVGEMVLDFTQELIPNETCENCVFLTPGPWRRYRGGSFLFPGDYIVAPLPQEWDQETGASDIGFRCVREIK